MQNEIDFGLTFLRMVSTQYVVIELADKLYNSVTACFCASQKYVFHIGLKREPSMD